MLNEDFNGFGDSLNRQQRRSNSSVSIQDFYKDKVVLLVGHTGILGKLLLESLVKKTQVKAVYLLLDMSGDASHRRQLCKQFFSEPIYHNLRSNHPTHFAKIRVVAGSVLKPSLGLNQKYRDVFLREVEVIFHCPLKDSFRMDFKTAVQKNLVGLNHLMDLARQMNSLKAYIFVSSIFTNFEAFPIEEKVYNSASTVANLRKINMLEDDLVKAFTPLILGASSNSYIHTLKTAEVKLATLRGIPVGIFRPALAPWTLEEGFDGVLEEDCALNEILSGIYNGIIHAIAVSHDSTASLVPVDYAAHCMIAAAPDIFQRFSNGNVSLRVYNFAPFENTISWVRFVEIALKEMRKRQHEGPLGTMFLVYSNSPALYKVQKMMFHYFPIALQDLCSWAVRRNERIMPQLGVLHDCLECLRPFMTRPMATKCECVEALWDHMSDEEKQDFPFDLRDLSWHDFIQNYITAIEVQEPTSIICCSSPREYNISLACLSAAMCVSLWTVLKFLVT